MNSKFALQAAIGMSILVASHEARSELLDFGSTYTISGNFGTLYGNSHAFTDTVALSSSAQTFDSGAYQITETTTPLSGGAEFAEFYITATSGGPLVPNGSTNGNGFDINLDNIRLTKAAVSSNYYFNFVTNGVANTGITPGGGVGVAANPNPGSLGAGQNAFNFVGFTPGAAATTTGYSQYNYPFDYWVGVWRYDPNATGYIAGVELTPGVPEMSTWGMLLLGFGGLGAATRWRSRRSFATA